MAEGRRSGGFADYLRLARLDHSTKHIFILPGVALAYLLRGMVNGAFAWNLALGLLTAICIASANYVINEWLDRDFDRHHPTKSSRAAVQVVLSGKIVLLVWVGLIALGLCIALVSSRVMFYVACIFALQGVVYNVPPLRSKDKPYLDVISESINNPLRLMIGWAIVDATTLSPSSILIAYWLGGAFLMAAKRLSEHREIVAAHGKELLVLYRASFRGYTEFSLLLSCFAYALLSCFFLTVFLIKYRVEYILLVPLIVILFVQYLGSALKSGSSAQSPEKLYRERGLVVVVLLIAATFVLTTLVDIPALSIIAAQKYIQIR